MDFEWDPDKAQANRRRHGVDFADAVGAFGDPFALTQEDPHPTEERFVTLGRDFLDRLVLVSATPRERRQYTEGLDDA